MTNLTPPTRRKSGLCPVCGKRFPVRPFGKPRVYCTWQCKSAARPKAGQVREEKRCPNCFTIYTGGKCGRCA